MTTPVSPQRRLILLSLSLYLGLASLAWAEPSMLDAAFLEHCFKCHGHDGAAEGEVDLDAASQAGLGSRPRLLERLIGVLKDREMPPEDEPELPRAKREAMIARLEAMLTDSIKNQSFGRTPMRRMNRFQYNNAVVDLLELDRDIFQLNERLMRRREDYFRPERGEMPAQVSVSTRPLSKDIDNQRPEGFRGVAAFPQDQRAEHGFDNRGDHLTLSPLLMESFLRLSETIVTSPDLNPRECRSWDRLFAAPGQFARGALSSRYEAETRDTVRFAQRPQGRATPQRMRGANHTWSDGAHLLWRCPQPDRELRLAFDASVPATGLRVAMTRAADYGIFELWLDGRKLSEPVDLYQPDVERIEHELRNLKIAEGPHVLAFKCLGKNDQSSGHFLGLDCFELLGQTPAIGQEPAGLSDSDAMEFRLRWLLRRAFRRPVAADTLDRFTQFANQKLDSGATFEETMRAVVGGVLSMPAFLYFYETFDEEQAAPDRVNQRLDDFELAARLAQFFWSSIPDDPLLDLAEAGILSQPATLSAQIDRMLTDRRSSRFCDNFPSQWLQLDRLITAIPDPKQFAYFYYNGYRTSMHMMSEPLLLFETVYIENRSILELLDPKFTWQSDMLAANYAGHSRSNGQVQVQTFKRVPLTDPRRGGVITNAAVMTMTSTPTRTQPITRGAWLNAVIFNDPPEPPPADVPPLPEANAEELAKLTIRERLAAHRQRADCAGCHNKIDPLGFALENFGPTGVWRDKYDNGRVVDVSGVMFNQYPFNSLVEFKRLLVQERQRFIRGFVSHLLAYALGRELSPADSPHIQRMTDQIMTGNDHLRSVLKQVAMSEPFLHKSQVPSAPVHVSSR